MMEYDEVIYVPWRKGPQSKRGRRGRAAQRYVVLLKLQQGSVRLGLPKYAIFPKKYAGRRAMVGVFILPYGVREKPVSLLRDTLEKYRKTIRKSDGDVSLVSVGEVVSVGWDDKDKLMRLAVKTHNRYVVESLSGYTAEEIDVVLAFLRDPDTRWDPMLERYERLRSGSVKEKKSRGESG